MRCTFLFAAGVFALAARAAAQTATGMPPRSLAYVLQAERLGVTRAESVRRLEACGRDWIVVDPSFDGSSNGTWTAGEIRTIRAGQPGRKVLAYLSIGEAEDYRAYWKREWVAAPHGRPSAQAPPWLGEANPAWKGNYRVRYWHADWQQITLARAAQAMQQGFDGIYLDVVDAFETFEYDPRRKDWIDNRRNPETGRTFREDMVAWVRRIAAQARQKTPGVLIVPQNGAQLLEDADYLAAIDAIGIEDLFTDGDKLQKKEHSDYTIGFLKRAAAAGKPVLLIEYGTKAAAVQRSVQGAKANQFVLLVTDRELKTLGQSGTAPLH